MFGGLGMNPSMDDINLIQQAQRHQLVVTNLGEEIDLEIGTGEDEAATNSLIGGTTREPSTGEHDETKHMVLVSDLQGRIKICLKGSRRRRERRKLLNGGERSGLTRTSGLMWT
ncbi:hypothetical protein Bca52824_038760 [Brassica carinata]|uniref:Uncharacterized protein n=1 Tax=Brassica carinata TaxID=52824 RepID=A0A8X7RPP7_BRACI|nr:hypothetical protein Bca52824_038760 [Brassica carinata]